MGENHFAPVPVALYGVVLLMAAISFTILVRVLIRHHGSESDLARAMGSNAKQDLKANISMVLYVAAIPCAFLSTWISGACFVAVAVLWLVPDKRIERVLVNEGS
jgi:uncharacterized membrane protein